MSIDWIVGEIMKVLADQTSQLGEYDPT
jgi:hypothetical protein